MIRVAHLSDLHFDAERQIAGVRRLTEDGQPYALAQASRCLRAVAKGIAAGGLPDVWLVTGDVFDRPQPTAAEEAAVIRAFVDLARAAPVVVLAGNHDIPGVAGAATALECLKRRPRIHVIEEPTLLEFGRDPNTGKLAPITQLGEWQPGVTIACMPYPRRAEFATSEVMTGAATSEERNAIASQLLSRVMGALRIQAAATKGPKVLGFHGSVTGAMSRFQPRTLAGDILFGLDDLCAWDYAAGGHIHQQQQLAPNAGYAGSVDRCDFGEEGEPKGGTVIELGDGPVRVRGVPSPATVFTTLDAESLRYVVNGDVTLLPSAAYRVKDRVSADDARAIRRDVAALQERGLWIADALEVDAEIRLRDAEANAEESAEAHLRRWLAGREIVAGVATRLGMETTGFIDAVVAEHERTEAAV